MVAHALWREVHDAPKRVEAARRQADRRAAERRRRAMIENAIEGDSDGGPGVWCTVNERMSERSAAYQEQITGRSASKSYVVAGIKFDGFGDGALIDAKGRGYAKLLKVGKLKNGKVKRRMKAHGSNDQSSSGLRNISEVAFRRDFLRRASDRDLARMLAQQTPYLGDGRGLEQPPQRIAGRQLIETMLSVQIRALAHVALTGEQRGYSRDPWRRGIRTIWRKIT
jgi:Restriction endonuclease fold toxin 5